MAKLAYDKYYTESDLAKHCVEKTFETIGSDWERVIEPSVGAGAFLPFLPEDTIYYDLVPDKDCPGTIEMDWREVKLPYIKQSLVIGNPPSGAQINCLFNLSRKLWNWVIIVPLFNLLVS